MAAPRYSQKLMLREPAMKGDARVIEYLNQGLRHELTAVNQFWLHYRLMENWGYNDLAKKWRKEFSCLQSDKAPSGWRHRIIP
jgi:hypothetical protein